MEEKRVSLPDTRLHNGGPFSRDVVLYFSFSNGLARKKKNKKNVALVRATPYYTPPRSWMKLEKKTRKVQKKNEKSE